MMANRAGRSLVTSAEGAARANAAVVRIVKESFIVGVVGVVVGQEMVMGE